MGWRLRQHGWHRREKHSARHTFGSVPRDVSDDLPAPGRVADEDGMLYIKCVEDRRHVVGVAVHVVIGRGLARSSMPASIVRDSTKPVLCQKQQDRKSVV